MVPRATLFRPIAVNSTITLSGTAGINCYRMALKIVAPNGGIVWYEYTNTASFSQAHTFNQVGLYTLTFVTRDINDSLSGSTTKEQTFTIRTY